MVWIKGSYQIEWLGERLVPKIGVAKNDTRIVIGVVVDHGRIVWIGKVAIPARAKRHVFER